MSKFGYESGDGIFSPGGSISNMYGMILARHKKFPELKATGLYGRSPLVAFTSDESHYSIAKGANWLGIGTENVVKVKTDDNGRMIPEELENEIQKTLLNGKVGRRDGRGNPKAALQPCQSHDTLGLSLLIHPVRVRWCARSRDFGSCIF